MSVVPPFDAEGLLPPGDYELSFDELRSSILGHGPADRQPSWDASWRLHLIDNLEILTRQLWQSGVSEVFADGSFAEEKDHPNDIDGYFVCSLESIRTGELVRQLNRLAPFHVWTWDPAERRPYRGYAKSNCRCGIAIGWNFIRTFRGWASEAAFETGMAMSWSFPPPFDSLGETESRGAS